MEYWQFPGQEERVSNVPERKEFLRVPVQTPDKHPMPIKIRILPFPFYEMRRHICLSGGSVKYLVCSAEHPEFGGECVGCFYSDQKSIVSSTQFCRVITVLNLNLVHKIEMEDGTISFEACRKNLSEGAPCDKCMSGNKPQIVGRRYWTVGPGYYGVLREKNLELASKCIHCGGFITLTSLQCPKCRSDLIPPQQLAKMHPIDQAKQVALTWTCPRCHQVSKPNELIQEATCNCGKVTRGSIYKYNLEVYVQQQDERRGGYKILVVKEKECGEIPKEYMESVQPYDFEEIFRPLPPERQAAILGVKNPFRKNQKNVHTVPYQEEPQYPQQSSSESEDLDVFE